MLQLTLALRPATAPTADAVGALLLGRPGALAVGADAVLARLHAALAGGALRRRAAVGVGDRRGGRCHAARLAVAALGADARLLARAGAVFGGLLGFLGRRDAVAETDVEPSSSPRSTRSSAAGRRSRSSSSFPRCSRSRSELLGLRAALGRLAAGGYRLLVLSAALARSRRRGRPRSTLSFTWVVDLPPCTDGRGGRRLLLQRRLLERGRRACRPRPPCRSAPAPSPCATMSFIVLASVAGLATALRSLSSWASCRSMFEIALSTAAFCACIVALVSPLRFGISSSSVACAFAELGIGLAQRLVAGLQARLADSAARP